MSIIYYLPAPVPLLMVVTPHGSFFAIMQASTLHIEKCILESNYVLLYFFPDLTTSSI